MLTNLKIHNIALIDDCEIDFESGLNVLSGETGAGKSVILDSINFLLGQKADKTMIQHGKTECSATCVFDISDCANVKSELDDLGLEAEDDIIIIKRTYNENGKGSIKVNGETVTATMLRKITSHLVDVHGQSEHFSLLKDSAQLELIDNFASGEVVSIKEEISKIIEKIKAVNEDLTILGGSDSERLKRLDLLEYSINEIENANLSEGEEEELLQKRKKLQNLEKIMSALNACYECLGGENGASDLLSTAYRQVSSLSNLAGEYEELADLIDSCVTQIQDINLKVSDCLDVDFDASEADIIERRIEDISRLKAKYGKSIGDIFSELERMKREFELISTSAEQAEKLKNKKAQLFESLNANYLKLTNARKAISAKISKLFEERLHELAMKNARFSIEFDKVSTGEYMSLNGIDKVEFMFSANLGEPLKPLGKVISGGELSRLMLAIKSVASNQDGASTLIFDEIDSGISGTTASVVAENFARISRGKQIIAISHLPQIVAMSDKSMLIKKIEDNNSTKTKVYPLSDQEKTFEVVRLIGGEGSVYATTHAKELIEKSNNFKIGLKK